MRVIRKADEGDTEAKTHQMAIATQLKPNGERELEKLEKVARSAVEEPECEQVQN